MRKLIFLMALTALSCQSPKTLSPLHQPLVKNVTTSDLSSGPLFQNEYSSFHWVVVTQDLKSHYHVDHEETVVVLEGNGVLVIAEEEFEVGPGTLIRIPKGFVHSFRPHGTVKAISIFSPPFNGKDRFFIDL